ncbi:MAG: hypothetical protein WDM87_04680 [Terracidiphilus sp.]
MNPVVLAVDDLREQYLKEMALVRQTCERTGDGTAAIRRRSAVVDRILIEMWRRAYGGLPPQKRAHCWPSVATAEKISSLTPTSTSCSLSLTKKPKSNHAMPFAP